MRVFLGVLGVLCGLLGAADALGPMQGRHVELPAFVDAQTAGIPMLGIVRAIGWVAMGAALLGVVGLWMGRTQPARGWPLLLVAGLGLLLGPSLFFTAGAVVLLLSAGLTYRATRPLSRRA